MTKIDAELQALLREIAPRSRFFDLVEFIDDELSNHDVGAEIHPSRDAVRFHHSTELSFSPGEVSDLKFEDGRCHITADFLGLVGTVSPIPLHLAEEVYGDESGDQAAFLDLFHHRSYGLLYQSWRQHRFRPYEDASWPKRLRALVGLDEAETAGDPMWLRLLPLLNFRSGATLSSALQHVVESEFPSARTWVEEFTGQVALVGRPDRIQLGVNARLGGEAILGHCVRDSSSEATFWIDGVDDASRHRFETNGDMRARLEHVIEEFVGGALKVRVRLAQPRTTSRLGVLRLGKVALDGKKRSDPSRLSSVSGVNR